jgi:spermidine synthase
MLFESRYEDALVIGLGTGRTAHIVQAMGFGHVDVAEIAPGIVEGARRYFGHVNGSVLDSPTTRLILEDGRNSLLLRPKQYDLITIEISSVWFAGATNLFSREFYGLVRDRLKPHGVFQQWLQLHHIGLAEIETVLVSLRSQLPEVSFWMVGGQGLLIASEVPQMVQAAFLERLPEGANEIGWKTSDLPARLRALAASRVLAPADVTRLARRGGAIPNTDRSRRLEYFTPRYNHVVIDLRRQNLRALASVASFPPIDVDPAASGRLADACRGLSREDYFRSLGIRTGANRVATPAAAP